MGRGGEGDRNQVTEEQTPPSVKYSRIGQSPQYQIGICGGTVLIWIGFRALDFGPAGETISSREAFYIGDSPSTKAEFVKWLNECPLWV